VNPAKITLSRTRTLAAPPYVDTISAAGIDLFLTMFRGLSG
jgi:hypothetical protein